MSRDIFSFPFPLLQKMLSTVHNIICALYLSGRHLKVLTYCTVSQKMSQYDFLRWKSLTRKSPKATLTGLASGCHPASLTDSPTSRAKKIHLGKCQVLEFTTLRGKSWPRIKCDVLQGFGERQRARPEKLISIISWGLVSSGPTVAKPENPLRHQFFKQCCLTGSLPSVSP